MGENDSREAQNARAVDWLLQQPGGPVAVVTPQRQFEGETLQRLVGSPGTVHLTWRGFSAESLSRRRVVYAWPDRQHLNALWGVHADAIVVIEWGTAETATWVEDAQPLRLVPGQTLQPNAGAQAVPKPVGELLREDVIRILESVAQWAAGYDTGLKWNEEDKLKADMMNRPERWMSVTVEQVTSKCRELKMRPNDIETIVGFLERRKQGRRFNVRSSYRDYQF
ncbi:hypothetical protein [Pseudarthrobacter sp. NamE5]|uniref:hypothetical protein n=1 Tax=Pseudarthrobacter sp. NamE5 TaxID=2576839 RepID=UPI001F0ED3FD|nr:hypothetical protein [Pseudarthrobacter sp. NamE5]